MATSYRVKLNDKLAEAKVLRRNIKTARKEKVRITELISDHEKARELFQMAANRTQKQIESHISDIVTRALHIVCYDDPYDFKVHFEPRRNTTECDLLFVDEAGNEMNPLDSCGYGAVDVASFALRVAYWTLSKKGNTIIVDEPFRHLSPDRQEFAAEMIREISKELELQFIIVTNEDGIKPAADRLFEVVKKDRVSTVQVLTE